MKNMDNTIPILVGTIIVIEYFARLFYYYNLAATTTTSSKGIKHLKYQKYNPIWGKYVIKG